MVSSKVGNTVRLTANRKYKDTVFRMLFSDKDRFLELYNAVSGRHYVNSDELQNVNYGRNLALMEQCRTLADYAQYVALVRKYKAELGSIEAAVRRAVDECIRNDVPADFLRKNRARGQSERIIFFLSRNLCYAQISM